MHRPSQSSKIRTVTPTWGRDITCGATVRPVRDRSSSDRLYRYDVGWWETIFSNPVPCNNNNNNF